MNNPTVAEWLKPNPNKGINDYYSIYGLEESTMSQPEETINNSSNNKQLPSRFPYIIILILALLVVGYLIYNKLFSIKPEINGKFTCITKTDEERISKNNFETQFINALVKSSGNNCLFQDFVFKGKSTVFIQYLNREVGVSYVIDDSLIRINLTGKDIILLIKDENTLLGKGELNGSL